MIRQRRVAMMIDLGWHVVRHHHVFAGIHRYAREKGNWDYSITPHADLLKGRRHGQRFDGIVARVTEGLAKQARKAGVPVVNVWLSSPVAGLPSVVHDAEAGGRLAAQHLLARGFRRFGYLGAKRDRGAQLQLAGFRDELAESGHSCSECWVSGQFAATNKSWGQFQTALHQWMEQWTPPIGVLTTYDLLARYVAEACHQHGLKVPQEVALVGSYNESVICNTPEPSLSSIDFRFDHIGYEAAKLLDKLMDGGAAPTMPIRMPPVELVARQSSDAFAVSNPIVALALRFIAEHAHEDISVNTVADHVLTTRRSLARYFQSSLRRSIAETITTMRLDRAKREMSDDELPLKTVATRCGFRDVIHLCRVFQRVVGMTPTQYRAKRKAGKEPENWTSPYAEK